MNLGLVLLILGLVLWLALGWTVIGIILLVLGIIWLAAPYGTTAPRRRYWW